jgi:hypothetical protein
MSTFYGTDPTIAENYATRVVQIGEHYAEVTILDVGASEGTWQAAFTDTMKQADAILLVYSIVNAPSLLYLDELIQLRDSIYLDRTKTPVCAGTRHLHPQQLENSNLEHLCVVMGNKLDLADQRREIPSQHGLSWATSHGMAFTEASALKGYIYSIPLELHMGCFEILMHEFAIALRLTRRLSN